MLGRMDEYQPLFQTSQRLPSYMLHSGTTYSSNLDYATPSFWISKETLLPCHNWNMQTSAVWNTAARLRLSSHSPTWVRNLACDIPEANWKHRNISNDRVLNACHPRTKTGFKKFKKLPLDF